MYSLYTQISDEVIFSIKVCFFAILTVISIVNHNHNPTPTLQIDSKTDETETRLTVNGNICELFQCLTRVRNFLIRSLCRQVLIVQFANVILRYFLPTSFLHVIHCHTTTQGRYFLDITVKHSSK